MAFAQGSRSRLSFGVQSNFTTTQTNLTTLPINSHSLNLSKAGIESAEIRSDRQVAVFRHGNKTIDGDISVEMRADDYDSLLESAFFNTFDSSGFLELGVTPRFLTFEDGALDIAQYRLFTGCGVNTFSISARPNEIVSASFGIVGRNMTISGTPTDATPTAATGNAVFDTFSATIAEAGSAISSITSFELTVENNFNPTFVIGSAITPFLEYGRARVTGSLTAYYEDADLITKFINETVTTLDVSFTDGLVGNTYTLRLPEVKLNGAAVPLENEQSRVITIPFVGLYDTTSGNSLFLTKS